MCYSLGKMPLKWRFGDVLHEGNNWKSVRRLVKTWGRDPGQRWSRVCLCWRRCLRSGCEKGVELTETVKWPEHSLVQGPAALRKMPRRFTGNSSMYYQMTCFTRPHPSKIRSGSATLVLCSLGRAQSVQGFGTLRIGGGKKDRWTHMYFQPNTSFHFFSGWALLKECLCSLNSIDKTPRLCSYSPENTVTDFFLWSLRGLINSFE